MRKQEASFDKTEKETKEGFTKRLRRTALTLPTSIVFESVGDMRRRVASLQKRKGGFLNE